MAVQKYNKKDKDDQQNNSSIIIFGLGAVALAGGIAWYLAKKKLPNNNDGGGDNGTVNASISNPIINPNPALVGDTISMTATVRNTGTQSHTFYVGCTIRAPNGFETDSINFNPSQPYKTISLDPGQNGDVTFTETLGQNTGVGNHTVEMAVWTSVDNSQNPPQLVQLLNQSSSVLAVNDNGGGNNGTVNATITNPNLSPNNASPGDTVRMTSTVTNTGGQAHNFVVGCTIRAPNGFETDSINFNPSQPYKTISLNPGQSSSVSFIETLGPNTGNGNHTVIMAVWTSVDNSQNPPLLIDMLDSGSSILSVSGGACANEPNARICQIETFRDGRGNVLRAWFINNGTSRGEVWGKIRDRTINESFMNRIPFYDVPTSASCGSNRSAFVWLINDAFINDEFEIIAGHVDCNGSDNQDDGPKRVRWVDGGSTTY